MTSRGHLPRSLRLGEIEVSIQQTSLSDVILLHGRRLWSTPMHPTTALQLSIYHNWRIYWALGDAPRKKLAPKSGVKQSKMPKTAGGESMALIHRPKFQIMPLNWRLYQIWTGRLWRWWPRKQIINTSVQRWNRNSGSAIWVRSGRVELGHGSV